MNLKYNKNKWKPIAINVVNTLQLFITNKCNKRCSACFYDKYLGANEMSLKEYCSYVDEYREYINKVILMGGEPTLHKSIKDMIIYNQSKGLKTTIYSNGSNLRNLKAVKDWTNVKLRIGIMGLFRSEKPLYEVSTNLPLEVVYMIRKNNIDELLETAYCAENFNCKTFFISSIRDIATTKDYWEDTPETLPLVDYVKVVQEFLNNYKGRLDVHISSRGMIDTLNEAIPACRFLNIFPGGAKVICPFDISLGHKVKDYKFTKRLCNKNIGKNCLFQKIIFRNIQS